MDRRRSSATRTDQIAGFVVSPWSPVMLRFCPVRTYRHVSPRNGHLYTGLLSASERLLGGDGVTIIRADIPLATHMILSRRCADDAVSRKYGVAGCGTHSPKSTLGNRRRSGNYIEVSAPRNVQTLVSGGRKTTAPMPAARGVSWPVRRRSRVRSIGVRCRPCL